MLVVREVEQIRLRSPLAPRRVDLEENFHFRPSTALHAMKSTEPRARGVSYGSPIELEGDSSAS